MVDQILNSLKKSREKAGLTQKEVEELLGMRSLMMRDYEIGRLKLPVSVAMQLAKLYQVSVDGLIGNRSHSENLAQSKVLLNLNTLFLGNGFSVMFLDPILRGFLEDHYERVFDTSLFDLLTHGQSAKQKKEVILEITKLLFSLARSDGKVSNEELECIRYLLGSFKMQNRYKEISVKSDLYRPLEVPKSLSRIEIRHFVIWILFFFSYADNKMTHQEIAYIEKCAERLKINTSNFLFIKKKFVKER